MHSRNRIKAFSFVEVLIAAVLLSLSVVAYLSLSSSEVRWSKAVEDRTKALTLARNMLTVIEFGYRKELMAGTPTGDGGYKLENAHQVLKEANLALGTALFKWVADKSALGDFGLDLTWNPAPQSGVGQVHSVGKAVCTVRYKLPSGDKRSVKLIRVLTR